jgi:hypothetical protein
VTPQSFRQLALSLPETAEKSHFGKEDFRVRNKIFASLPDDATGVVKLMPEQQEMLMASEPEVFSPASGAWGRQGWTRVSLPAVDDTTMRSSLNLAWRNAAPKDWR